MESIHVILNDKRAPALFFSGRFLASDYPPIAVDDKTLYPDGKSDLDETILRGTSGGRPLEIHVNADGFELLKDFIKERSVPKSTPLEHEQAITQARPVDLQRQTYQSAHRPLPRSTKFEFSFISIHNTTISPTIAGGLLLTVLGAASFLMGTLVLVNTTHANRD